MNYKKFEQGDILRNNIKTYPHNSIFIDNTGSVYIKNLSQMLSSDSKNSNIVVGTNYNILGNEFSTATDTSFRNSSVAVLLPFYTEEQTNISRYTEDINSFSRKGFLSSSIKVIAMTSSNSANFTDTSSNVGVFQRLKIKALKNTLNWYTYISQEFSPSNYSEEKTLSLLNIPSVFYGSSIKKGSVELNYYITGTLVGTLKDIKNNGELIQTYPSNSQETLSSSCAGVVLYAEGILLLTGSWVIPTSSVSVIDRYNYVSTSAGETINNDSPRWIHWGKSSLKTNLLNSSSYEINFDGTNIINTITMFTHADKNEFNTTNNKTSIKRENFNYFANSSSNNYTENSSLYIKNTVSSSYETVSGSFKRQTFINKIAIYDKDKNIIAIAKLSKPIKKNNERDYTIKLKLDL